MIGRRHAMEVLGGALGAGLAAATWPARARASGPEARFVSPEGRDETGTGSQAAPFRTPQRALADARPGQTIFLRPGLYPPVMVETSGAPGQPITLTTLPGEERQAVLRGDLQQHAVHGGPGARQDLAWRSGVRIAAQSHIHIRNLTIEDCAHEGILILGGDAGTQHGHHVLAGNLIRRTGNSGIMVAGFMPRQRRPSEPRPRLVDVLIEGNDVSATNVVSDFNRHFSNSAGEPGGVNEAITVTSSCGQIVTRHNDVHDTRQYGIDYKAGVAGGAIHDNRIWNVARYGIYLDTGRNTLRDIAVYNNRIQRCRIGIALAREADIRARDPNGTPLAQSLINISVFNNICWDMALLGLYCQGHPGDGPQGEITDVRLRFNTLYNCNRSGRGNALRLERWADPAWRAAGVVQGFDCVGNIIYNSDGPAGVVDQFSGHAGFTVAANLVDVDPRFVGPGAGDFALQPGSPARGLVDPSFAQPPFDRTAADIPRAAPANAGAL